jgi:hypothetical protein
MTSVATADLVSYHHYIGMTTSIPIITTFFLTFETNIPKHTLSIIDECTINNDKHKLCIFF